MRRRELFFGFFKLGAIAFGGTGPITRHIVVEERRWLDEQEFAGLLGLCQALPGANTCNFAVMLGDRFCGASGALVALAGLLAAPLVIVVLVASFFAAFAQNADMRAALYGATAAGAGLAIGAAVKMAKNVPRDPLVFLLAGATFALCALARLPLPLIVAVLAPAGFLVVGRK